MYNICIYSIKTEHTQAMQNIAIIICSIAANTIHSIGLIYTHAFTIF